MIAVVKFVKSCDVYLVRNARNACIIFVLNYVVKLSFVMYTAFHKRMVNVLFVG